MDKLQKIKEATVYIDIAKAEMEALSSINKALIPLYKACMTSVIGFIKDARNDEELAAGAGLKHTVDNFMERMEEFKAEIESDAKLMEQMAKKRHEESQ